MDRGFFHSSTHAFDPLPAYVALAVIDSIEKDNLVQKSKEKGNYLKAGLQKLAKKHLVIGDVRGRGLLQGIELVKNRGTKEPAEKETHMVYRRCIEKGLMLRTVGMPNSHCTLNFCPSFYVTREEIETSLNILDEVLSEVEKKIYA